MRNLYTQQQDNPIKNGERTGNTCFSKEEIQMANSYMKRCSSLLVSEKCNPKSQSDITFITLCVCWLLSHVRLCEPTDCSLPGSSVHGILCPWNSRQKYWNGLPFPSPWDFPNPGIEPGPPALQADSLLLSHQGNPEILHYTCFYKKE